MKFDLHIHSTCSDGRFTPKQVFEEANQRNIKLLSITDHDTIECQQEAIELDDPAKIISAADVSIWIISHYGLDFSQRRCSFE